MIVHLLGTGSANAGPDRTTTMLALEHAGHTVQIDCGGDAVLRMMRAGLDPVALDALVLTHEHPDHISGYPLLIEKLWLMGRRAPIDVYGPAETLEKAEALFVLFNTKHWDGLPERRLHPVDLEDGTPVLDLDGLRLTAWPVDHPVPTIGLRIEADGMTVAYSCDTAKSDTVVGFSRGADLLLHEATGSLAHVHSSALEAAEVALEAGVGSLVLVHAPAGAVDADLEDARAVFEDVRWGCDGDRLEVGVAAARA